MSKKRKCLIGFASSLLLVTYMVWGGYRVLQSSDASDSVPKSLRSISQYLVHSETLVVRQDDTQVLRAGDPIFASDSSGVFRQIGIVQGPSSSSNVGQVELVIYDPSIDPNTCQFIQHHNRGRLSEVVKTLLPPDKQERIAARIRDAVNEHGREIAHAMAPLMRQTLEASLPIIEEEFRASIQRHRRDIDSVADRWQSEIVEQRLIPMARREVLPIVKRHGQEPAEKIGREIWDRASLWRFGWRALYDRTPLPRRDLLQAEWQRFVQEEAIPVLEDHMDEVVVAIQRSLTDIAADPEIRRELRDVAESVASDPKTQQLVQTVLRETFIKNDRLKQAWAEVWNSPQAKRALGFSGDRVEPIVRKIGDEIFGSREDGIDPGFARVLRSQILLKDRRWVVAEPASNPSQFVVLSQEPMEFPVVYMADKH